MVCASTLREEQFHQKEGFFLAPPGSAKPRKSSSYNHGSLLSRAGHGPEGDASHAVFEHQFGREGTWIESAVAEFHLFRVMPEG